jgi:pimeloyl-ACP methyl ester carboxylesterase
LSIIEHIMPAGISDDHDAAPPLLADAGMTRFKVAGESLSAYVEIGSGRPVLFLHGNSSTKSVWSRQVIVAREQGWTVIVPDLPGHGDSENSPSPETTYSFPGYAAVIGALLDALGIDAVDVVGWSLGGHIGLQLLATEDRVASLLITGAPPARPSVEALEQAFYAADDMKLAGKAGFSEADALAYGTDMMGGSRFLIPELLQSIKRTDGNARRFMFANALRGVGIDQRAAVMSIDKPLCVVHGELDPFVRLDYLSTIGYRALWKDSIFVISGAGHAPHWEQPVPFNCILAGFLRYTQEARSPG